MTRDLPVRAGSARRAGHAPRTSSGTPVPAFLLAVPGGPLPGQKLSWRVQFRGFATGVVDGSRLALSTRFVVGAAVVGMVLGSAVSAYLFPRAEETVVEKPVVTFESRWPKSEMLAWELPPSFRATAIASVVPAPVSPAATLSFEERFSPAAAMTAALAKPADLQAGVQLAAVEAVVPQFRSGTAVPMPAARPASARTAPRSRDIVESAQASLPPPEPSIFERLFGKSAGPSKPLLSFASADPGAGFELNQKLDNGEVKLPAYDRTTAVYDISAKTVYLPNGTKLEAHSGLGSKMDDPRHVHVRMSGPTPPHVYDLEPREARFHGVAALRLKPVGGQGAIFGRTGLLAHSYLLGPNGDSNGCVSFKNYDAFLAAYRNGEIKRLAVVAKMD